jgi:ABC-type phosphate transport system permease subunit
MLPSVFTVMRESNERIPSVWATAGTAISKTRKQAVKKFFMGVRFDYSLAAGRQEEESCASSKLP